MPDSIDELLAEARARRQRTQAGQCDPHGDVAQRRVFSSCGVSFLGRILVEPRSIPGLAAVGPSGNRASSSVIGMSSELRSL